MFALVLTEHRSFRSICVGLHFNRHCIVRHKMEPLVCVIVLLKRSAGASEGEPLVCVDANTQDLRAFISKQISDDWQQKTDIYSE